MLATPSSDVIDAFVCRRLREARLTAGITAATLSLRTGVSAKQISKFELGQNRIHISQLWLFAAALDRPISWFFEGAPTARVSSAGKNRQVEFFDALSQLNIAQIEIISRMAGALVAEARRTHRQARRHRRSGEADDRDLREASR
ncbi:helix-turn-helix transcriptional regulator [Roseomonas sp. JC162]|uniref:Helix-turn-helix transcriptional regulator n=1 Tax=Neoroseomonas marina TaxID=1232220 RepID=A0A848ED80_9PROT|nr:helix-turn-helix transcriptional regulator [Neoroseomonas marina]